MGTYALHNSKELASVVGLDDYLIASYVITNYLHGIEELWLINYCHVELEGSCDWERKVDAFLCQKLK
jgi:hypothetical protein